MNNIEQGSPEWMELRCGKITGSRIANVMSWLKKPDKEGNKIEAADRKAYRLQIITERLTGTTENKFKNKNMERGTELEPYAREAYEFHTGSIVEQIAFVDHPIIAMSGASPDGLVDANGLIEIKCPQRETHCEYMIDDKVPSEYMPQMAWQKLCTGRDWIDFVSYCPEMPAHLQLFVKRYVPEQDYLMEIEHEVIKFNLEVDEILIKLLELGK